MTFDDDFMAFNTGFGTARVLCKAAGIEWPPPETLIYAGVVYKRRRCSGVSDSVRGSMTALMRGAEYTRVGVLVENGSTHYN